MRAGTLAFRLGLLAIVVVTVAVAVIGSRESPPPTAAQAPTDRLTAEVTPADCGAVTAQQTSDTATSAPATEWTFPQSAYVRVTAKAEVGCTFTRFELVLGGSVVHTSRSNPWQLQLFRGLTTTVRAHFSGTPTSCTSNTGIAADCAALLAAKDTLRGTAPLNWSTGTAITEWDGVTLGGTPPRVTGLSLRMLRGTLPAKLGDLTALTSLKLEWGKLRGSIPTELGKLTKLRTLSLYRNSLGGGIPADLGKLTELRTLSLSQNFLTGGIPTELGKLTHLEGLFLYQNKLTGNIPAELEKLTNLSSLYLSENEWEGCLPRTLRTVTNNDLATLDLPSCPLPTTTLSYDSYDKTGAVTTAGSYAFLTEADDGTMSAVTTYEALRDGTTTSLRLHTSDADGTSQAVLYDLIDAGDVLEWREAGQCWVRYRGDIRTAARGGRCGPRVRGRVGHLRLHRVQRSAGHDHCCIRTGKSASLHLGRPRAPVRHGPYLLHPIGWDGPLQPQVATAPLGGAQGSSSADRAVSDDLAVVMAHPFWREPDFPDGWTLHSAAVGYEGIDGYFAIYLDARGGFGADVQVARLPRLPDYVSAPDGLSIYEARTIDGHPAVVRYSPTGDLTHETSVYIFHEATGIEYLVVGVSPRAGGSPDIVIAAARSLYRAAGQ